MSYQTNPFICTPFNTVALEANVQSVINAINSASVIPYGDYGGSSVYYFQTFENALGNFIYTMFDRATNLGLATFSVRFGAASTIRDVLFGQYPRSQLSLQYVILPYLPLQTYQNGSVTP